MALRATAAALSPSPDARDDALPVHLVADLGAPLAVPIVRRDPARCARCGALPGGLDPSDHPAQTWRCALCGHANRGFLAPDAVQTGEVLNRTAAAASLVRFERIDRSIDEQVYLQICTTLLHCIICPAGKLLNDSAVWLCVKTCYDISISDTLSPIVCRFSASCAS